MISQKLKSNFKISRLLIFIIFLGFCSCDISYIIPEITNMQTFYQSEDKLWAHRNNTIEGAVENLKEFKGIEFDVVFSRGTDFFDIRHDIVADPSKINLDDYFSAISNPSDYYYWIDFKNLNIFNDGKSADRLFYIAEKYNIIDKIIVESKNIKALQKFVDKGFNVSWWISTFDFKLSELEVENKQAYKILQELNDIEINAFSCHYPMYEFLNFYFPNTNIHIWTNGMSGEEDKEIIEDFALNDNIKIILVDYNENFLVDKYQYLE